MPEKSLNFGVSKAKGLYNFLLDTVYLKSHWLDNLIKPFKKYNNLAGVYGRQEPFRFTTDTNKETYGILLD